MALSLAAIVARAKETRRAEIVARGHAQRQAARRPSARGAARQATPLLAPLLAHRSLLSAGKRYLGVLQSWPKKPLSVGYTFDGDSMRVVPPRLLLGWSNEGTPYYSDGHFAVPGEARLVRAFLKKCPDCVRVQVPGGYIAEVPQGREMEALSRELYDYVAQSQLGQPGFAANIGQGFWPVVPMAAILVHHSGGVDVAGGSSELAAWDNVEGARSAAMLEIMPNYAVGAVRLAAVLYALGEPDDVFQVWWPDRQQSSLTPLRVVHESSGRYGVIMPTRLN